MVYKNIIEQFEKNCVTDTWRRFKEPLAKVNVFLNTKLDDAAIAVKVAEKLGTLKEIGSGEERPKPVWFIAGNKACWERMRWAAETKEVPGWEKSFLLEEEMLSFKLESSISPFRQAAAVIMLEVSSAGRQIINELISEGKEFRSISIDYVKPVDNNPEVSNAYEAEQSGVYNWVYDELVLEHEQEQLPPTSKHWEKEYKKSTKLTKLDKLKPYVIYGLSEIADIRDFAAASYLEKQSVLQAVGRRLEKTRDSMGLLVENLQKINRLDYLNALEEKYKELKELCEFQAKLLAAIGISEDMVNDSFALIKAKRLELAGELSSPDPETAEQALGKLSNTISQQVMKLTKKVMTISNKEEIEATLQDLLGTEVWSNKLCEESRSYLFTAEANYQLMIARKDKEQLDYSGICLLLSKTMEKELHRRFYEAYVNYLEDPANGKRWNIDWPKGLKNKDASGNYYKVDKDYFTLGSVMYAVGILYDKAANTYRANRYDFPKFKDFAEGRIYPSRITECELENYAAELSKITKKVADDFRNPAAHRNGIAFVKAEECREYMIMVHKKLKEILTPML